MQDKPPVESPGQSGFPIPITGNPVLSNTESHTTMKGSYRAKSVQRLSIAQILLGASAILLQIWDIFNGSVMSVCGTGIWTGILFIIAGSLGIHSSKTGRMCTAMRYGNTVFNGVCGIQDFQYLGIVVAFLVMSVIAALFTASLLILSAFSAGAAVRYRQVYAEYDTYPSTSSQDDDEYMVEILDMTAAIAVLLVLVSLAEAMVAIVSSCFACKILCCSDARQQSVLIQGQVQYITGPNGQTQMVIIPMQDQANVLTANPPYQLTSPVRDFQSQPLSVPQGEMPAGHNMSLDIPQLHQLEADAPSQPPSYTEKAAPPPEYEKNEKATSG